MQTNFEMGGATKAADDAEPEILDDETEEIMTDMFGEGGKEEVKEYYKGQN